jgi:chromatin assembly factor 1 subunit B
MDVCWSADGSAMLSGSVDNKGIVWDMTDKRRGHMITQFANHKHFVQGVAWDPAQQFVVTQSADRTCKVYALRPTAAGRKNKISQHLLPACDTAKEFYCAQTLSKKVITKPAENTSAAEKPERVPLFLDESIPTFFRRLSWSPDGSFLVVPAGTHSTCQGGRNVNTAFLYARGMWSGPIAHLPAQNKPVVAVRFCPALLRRRTEGSSSPPAPFDALPYKMVFAVATLDSVIIYDTESLLPLAMLGQLHYDSITDLAWSRDGQYLAVASRDCYCSIAVFQSGELGERVPLAEVAPDVAKRLPEAQQVAENAANVALSPVEAARGAEEVKAAPCHPDADVKPPAYDKPVAQGKRRIVPSVILTAEEAPDGTKDQIPKRQKSMEPGSASKLSNGTASGPAVDGDVRPMEGGGNTMDKDIKRITPTLILAPSKSQQVVESGGVGTIQPKSALKSGVHRRITPVPVASAPVAAQMADVGAPFKSGMSIAAMALAAGQEAAATAADKGVDAS